MSKYEAKMRFYHHENGDIVCKGCRDVMLANVDVALTAYAGYQVAEEDHVRRNHFEALGNRPWAGEEVGERYIQCDRCLQQWGPDA